MVLIGKLQWITEGSDHSSVGKRELTRMTIGEGLLKLNMGAKVTLSFEGIQFFFGLETDHIPPVYLYLESDK